MIQDKWWDGPSQYWIYQFTDGLRTNVRLHDAILLSKSRLRDDIEASADRIAMERHRGCTLSLPGSKPPKDPHQYLKRHYDPTWRIWYYTFPKGINVQVLDSDMPCWHSIEAYGVANRGAEADVVAYRHYWDIMSAVLDEIPPTCP